MTRAKAARIDPVNAAVWLVIFNVTVLEETRVTMQLLYGVEALLFAFLVLRVSARRLFHMSHRIVLLPAMLFLFHLFVHSGRVIVDLGPLRVTDQGLMFGLLYFLRFLNAVTAAISFALSVRLDDLRASLARIGLPDRTALSVYLTLRYIPLMTTEGLTIWSAVRTRRGLRVGPDVFERGRVFRQYLTVLVIRAVERAETTALAIQYRQFGAVARRTHISASRWEIGGLAFLVPHAIIALLGLWGLPIS